VSSAATVGIHWEHVVSGGTKFQFQSATIKIAYLLMKCCQRLLPSRAGAILGILGIWFISLTSLQAINKRVTERVG
jgi:hypothetical protein